MMKKKVTKAVSRLFPDPRVPVLLILAGYLLLGFTVLGFNRSPFQILVTSVTACLFELFLMWVFNKEGLPGQSKRFQFPLSALITSLGLSILLNYSHSYSLLF